MAMKLGQTKKWKFKTKGGNVYAMQSTRIK